MKPCSVVPSTVYLRIPFDPTEKHTRKVQTNLRVYVFCCAGASARDEWVAALMEAQGSTASGRPLTLQGRV